MSIEAAIRVAGVALGRSVLVFADLVANRLMSLFPAAAIEVEWGATCFTAMAIETTRSPRVSELDVERVERVHAHHAELIIRETQSRFNGSAA